MFQVPLYIEGLRSRPTLMFWLAVIAQAVLWVAVPLVFYSAPPGDLPRTLAVGHEFPLQSEVGPPLAFWLAEIVFRLAGLFGVYVLAQLCVIVAYGCVFALGRSLIGATHAAIAVLLMVGISTFGVPTPDFGPAVLAMPLWAASVLFYWRAAMEERSDYWYALAGTAILLLFTTEAALILVGSVFLFAAMTPRGRAAARRIDPALAAGAVALAAVAHVYWLFQAGLPIGPAMLRLREETSAAANTLSFLRLLTALLIAHAGIGVLMVLAAGFPRTRAAPVPAIIRRPVSAEASAFVGFFALVPALLAITVTVIGGQRFPPGGTAPLEVLSGLAVIVFAGDSLTLYHQRILGYAWAGLMVVPAAFVPLMIAILPWATGTELKVAQPAAAMGRFFADSFERRTGHSLEIVAGEPRAANLVALTAPGRPHVYSTIAPERTPWVSPDDLRDKGAVVVWIAPDSDPTPPPSVKARFPNLVAEVPHNFPRPVRGRMPPLLIGWGVIRPSDSVGP
jgi:hypothetical protein